LPQGGSDLRDGGGVAGGGEWPLLSMWVHHVILPRDQRVTLSRPSSRGGSWRRGSPSQSPATETEKAPHTLPRRSRSAGGSSSSRPERYPATNASPAPTGSTALTVR